MSEQTKNKPRVTSTASIQCKKPELGEMLARSALRQPSSLPAAGVGRKELIPFTILVWLGARQHVQGHALGKHQLLGFAPRTF